MSSSSAAMNKYWIPHLDIHKKVITQELQYYLGPEATVRSFTREVSSSVSRESSRLTAAGRRWLSDHNTRALPDRCEPPRTARWNPDLGREIDTRQEQIDDICVKSKDMWEKQAAARASGSSTRVLKRPLHQPVVISKASASDSTRRRRENRRRNESRSRRDERRRN